MKRIAALPAAVAAFVAVGAGVAIAASSPTVATGRAVSITDISAKLEATVNPNGNDTGYVIQYGYTGAYGVSTSSRSVGSGTKVLKVALTVGGLTPGTVYHYRVVALNKSGSATGSDRQFRTTGHPPAAVVTGPPSSVRKTIATLTGSVDPMGETTSWVLQYGLTSTYSVSTFPQSLPALTTSLPVSIQLSGLAPATLFHYRIVAFHGSNVISAGNDGTFFTEPGVRPKPRLSATTKPGVAKKSPYVFTTSGALRGAGFIPASSRCSGTVQLSYFQGRKRVGVVAAPVGGDCKFSAQETFHRRPGRSAIVLRVAVHYRGNGYLSPADATNHVTAG